MELILGLFTLVLCAVFTLQVGYIRSLRADFKQFERKYVDPEEKRTRLIALLDDEFVNQLEFEAKYRALLAHITEVQDYAIRNVNKHIAINGRQKRKEEEEELMQQILEFGTGSEAQTPEPERVAGRGSSKLVKVTRRTR